MLSAGKNGESLITWHASFPFPPPGAPPQIIFPLSEPKLLALQDWRDTSSRTTFGENRYLLYVLCSIKSSTVNLLDDVSLLSPKLFGAPASDNHLN